MKSLQTSYLLALAGLLTPFAGLHLFYLNRPVLGVIFLCTWGFFGLGTLVDLLRLPTMVERENFWIRALEQGPPTVLALPEGPPKSEESKILTAAHAQGGALTVALASVETGIPLKTCRKLLERMKAEGFCAKDVSEEGVDLYVFPGLRSNKPFELD